MSSQSSGFEKHARTVTGLTVVSRMGGLLRDATMSRVFGISPLMDGGFVCVSEDSEACFQNSYYSCADDGEFLRPVIDDCGARDLVGCWRRAPRQASA